jgi:hypothetical protein
MRVLACGGSLRSGALLLLYRHDDARFAFVFEAVAFALYLDNLCVMQESVQHGGSQHAVTGLCLSLGDGC